MEEVENLLQQLEDSLCCRQETKLVNSVIAFRKELNPATLSTFALKAELKKFLQVLALERLDLAIQLTQEEVACVDKLAELSNPGKDSVLNTLCF